MLRKPALIVLLTLLPAAALAQANSEDKTVQRTEKIVTQPARDVGIAKDKIPPVLQESVEETYRLPKRGCSDLLSELARLNEALGPDFDGHAKGDDRATQLAEAGGSMIVDSLIPFRGIVREVSGAAAADRRKAAALNAGLARRGFLRGLASARKCAVPVSPPAPAK